MILYQIRWFGYASQYKSAKGQWIPFQNQWKYNDSRYNSMKYKCLSFRNNDVSMILNTNQRNINEFVSKSIKLR